MTGQVLVPEVELWWPHTHGEPALYAVDIDDPASGENRHHGYVGFRALQAARDLVADGLALRINGEPIFARGAVWTPVSLRAPDRGTGDWRP